MVDEAPDGGSVALKKGLGRCRVAEIGAQKLGEDFASHHPMPLAVRMYAVRLKLEGGVGFSDLVEFASHRGVDIDHGPAIGAFRDEPLTECDEVLLVWIGSVGGIVDGRGAQNDLFGAGFQGRVAQACDRLAEALEAGFIVWQAAAIVHSVAGHDQVGFRGLKGAIESGANTGPGKSEFFQMAGIFFGQKIRSRFTGEADVDDFDLEALREKPALDVGHVIARLGDAVAKKNDFLNTSQRGR